MKTMSLKIVLALVLLTIVTTAGVVYFLMREGSENIVENSICLSYSKDSVPTLQKGFIDDMKGNYYNNQLSILKNPNNQSRTNLEGGDTQSIWFDLEKLKKFIYHIENKAKQSNISSESLGIRMHFITYPTNDNWQNYTDLNGFDKEEIYRSRMSLILVPTKKIEEKNVDFNLLTNTKLEFIPYALSSTNMKMMSTGQKNRWE
jgi:hypothetical protein